jgi:hypothetical protein
MAQSHSRRWSWTKTSLVALAMIVCLIGAGALRWYVAQQRAKDLATKVVSGVNVPALASVTASQALSAPGGGTTATYKLPESASRATIHLHAIESYKTRSAADLAALPPLGEPMTPQRLASLRKLADEGNARAACSLAKEAEKCVFYPAMMRKEMAYREAQLQQRSS